jgi:alkanesulfonate monooxygenase SsuD/methylene tetrahydromethanopterin reductase-like flavin-dependent oxidoreductase (luciferase family)
MRFGIFYEHQLPRPWDADSESRLYRDALEQIEIADRVGFDYVWEVEHHFMEEYSHSSAPEVFLAAVSQRTKQIRLGHGIVQIPHAVNHPARVAERVATLDLVSGGRVDFGTGESSSAAELGGFGVRRGEKRAMWEDAMEAISRMFVEEPFAGWESRHLQMPPRNVIPKPVQKPHPPMWVACSRRETIHFAARKGIGALSFSFVEPEDAGKWVSEYYRLIASPECVPCGFAVNPNVTVVLPMMIHEDERTAIERGIDGAHFFGYALAHYYGVTPHEPGRTNVWEEFGERRAARGFDREAITADRAPLGVNIGSLRGAVGTPDQLTELIRRYEAAGVDQICFVLQAGPNRHEHICESLELFGKQVIPQFAAEREDKERAKAERLGEAIEAALARRDPPRQTPAGYRIDEAAELTRARRVRRARRASRPALAGAQGVVRAARRQARLRGRKALAGLVRGRSDAALEHRFGPAMQRALFTAMARSFRPKMAFGFEGEIEFQLTRRRTEPAGPTPAEPAATEPATAEPAESASSMPWTLEVKGNRATSRSGHARDPVLVLRIGVADFLRMVSGTANPGAILLDGRLEIEGDPAWAPRIEEMFGGASPY